MKYPAELRAKLLDSPLQISEDNLFVFVMKGTVRRWPGSDKKHFFIEYTLCVMTTDFKGPEAGLMLFINDWLDEKAAQDADVRSRDGNAYDFESDLISNDAVDIIFLIPLRECVMVTETADDITLEYS